MIVAGIQMACTENREQNVQKAIQYIGEAARSGARLVFMQEIFSTIFFPCDINRGYFEWAETIAGETIGRMRAIARELNIWLVPTLFEKDQEIPGRYFNAAVVLSPEGQVIGRFRKTHIPYRAQNTEKYYFTPGNIRNPVFQADNLRFGINICYDRHFPELARIIALKGAHLIAYPTASKKDVGRANTWVPEMISRAAENVFYVLGLNRCGQEGPYTYFGHSVIVDPYGQIITSLEEQEGLVMTEIDPGEVEKARVDYAHLRDLRYDMYQEMFELAHTKQG